MGVLRAVPALGGTSLFAQAAFSQLFPQRMSQRTWPDALHVPFGVVLGAL